MASSYEMTYDEKRLDVYIKPNEFSAVMKHLNDTANAYWPCSTVIWIGYLLGPFTAGLSFLLPNLCISDSKKNLIAAVDR